MDYPCSHGNHPCLPPSLPATPLYLLPDVSSPSGLQEDTNILFDRSYPPPLISLNLDLKDSYEVRITAVTCGIKAFDTPATHSWSEFGCVICCLNGRIGHGLVAGSSHSSIRSVCVLCTLPRYSMRRSPNNVTKRQKNVTACALVMFV